MDGVKRERSFFHGLEWQCGCGWGAWIGSIVGSWVPASVSEYRLLYLGQLLNEFALANLDLSQLLPDVKTKVG